MDRTVTDLNIAQFRKMLSVEVDPVKRQTLERLLAEELAKLEHVQTPKKDSSDKA